MEDNLIEVSVTMDYSDMTYAVDLVLKGLTLNCLCVGGIGLFVGRGQMCMSTCGKDSAVAICVGGLQMDLPEQCS